MRRYFNENFTIKSGLVRFETRRPYRSKWGYMAYNSVGEHVGYIFMSDDLRRSSYGTSQLYFLPEFENKYGVWHIIFSHGSYIMWERITENLKQKKEMTIYVY